MLAGLFLTACFLASATPVFAAEPPKASPSSGSLVVAKPAPDGKSIRIAVRTSAAVKSGFSLVQLVDESGAIVKTLYAGVLPGSQQYTLNFDGAVAPGKYRVRMRESIEIEFAGALPRPGSDKGAWINPTEVVVRGPWVYVVDAGKQIPDYVGAVRDWRMPGADPAPMRYIGTTDGVVTLMNKAGANATVKFDELNRVDQAAAKEAEDARQKVIAEQTAKTPVIVKIGRDGKPDAKFAEKGVLKAPGWYSLRAIQVDADDVIYLGSGSHEVMMYDATGKRVERMIGGWDNDPMGPKCLVWVNSIALGRGNVLYVPNAGYGNIKVYDRTKKGFEGILYAAKMNQDAGWARCISADPFGSGFVLVNRASQLEKYSDDGKALTLAYSSDAADKLANAVGPMATGGLVFLACHGPGFGPYWDSGGGGEIVVYWDDGAAFKLAHRIGFPGTGATRAEFLNPTSVAITPDQSEMWVAEDSAPNPEGPPGNNRVRKFVLKPAVTTETEIEVPASKK